MPKRMASIARRNVNLTQRETLQRGAREVPPQVRINMSNCYPVLRFLKLFDPCSDARFAMGETGSSRMTNPLVELAGCAVVIGRGKLSSDLEHHARRALVDWFGCLIAGSDTAPATLLAEALTDEAGAGGAYCYVDGARSGIRRAALINATASHTVEFDDIYRDAAYHPGCPTIGAALAAAQASGSDFQPFLSAIAAGYDVSCRIGVAVQPSHYRNWHTTGTVGTFGAAVAVAILQGAGEKQVAHAIATAATMAGGLQQAFRSDGMSKPLHAGHAAEAGALAGVAAARGVTGALDVLDGAAGFAAATSDSTGNWIKALGGLGSSFAIASMTFKNHGCCGHIFAALDAVRDLQIENGFEAADVAAIGVEGYRATKDVCDRPSVSTEQEARFSVQYTIANLLLFGGVRLAAFAPERLRDPAIRELMTKIAVSVDAECEAAFPAQRSARVRVRLIDGREFARYQPTRKGDPDAPLTDAELSEKFLELTAPMMGATSAAEFLEGLWQHDEMPAALALKHHRRHDQPDILKKLAS
jgi:2-methylcitrate dehydratase PrpD